MNAPTTFHKVRFSRGAESTAGIVLTGSMLERMTIGEISRLFPMTEARKMHDLEISPPYETQDGALAHDFGKAH